MKTLKLNFGLIGRLLLNTELLNNTNISKYLSQDLIDKLNKEYVEYIQTKRTKDESKGNFAFEVSNSVDTKGQETKWITINCENSDQKEELYLNENNEFAKKGKMFKILKKTREMKMPKDTHFEIEFHN